jgi:hypothetical protein
MTESSEPTNARDRYAAAQERARAKLDFYKHLATYALVIAMLAILNVITSPSYLWFLWPAAGWGIGLVAHATNVFAFSDTALKRLTERELRRQR